MTTESYGTLRYYTDMFSDINADAQGDDPSVGDTIVEAFKLSLKEWRKYYEEGAKEIERIQAKVDDEI